LEGVYRVEVVRASAPDAFAKRTPRRLYPRLEGFAENFGKLLGQAQGKAEGWLGQRKVIAAQLTNLRDAANGLLSQLGVGVGRRPGRPRKPIADDGTSSVAASRMRKKCTMSAEARAKISAAQKARSAKQRKTSGKS
jgi:hypothetical protein